PGRTGALRRRWRQRGSGARSGPSPAGRREPVSPALRGWQAQLKRYGAPAAFLAAVTVAVLLVRAGLNSSPAQTSTLTTRATTAATPASRGRPRSYRPRAAAAPSGVALRLGPSAGS